MSTATPVYRPALNHRAVPAPDPARVLDPRYGERTPGIIWDPDGEHHVCWARYVYTDGTALVCTWGMAEQSYWTHTKVAAKSNPRPGFFIPNEDPRAQLVTPPAGPPAAPDAATVGPWVERLDRLDRALAGLAARQEALIVVVNQIADRVRVPDLFLRKLFAALPTELGAATDPYLAEVIVAMRAETGIVGKVETPPPAAEPPAQPLPTLEEAVQTMAVAEAEAQEPEVADEAPVRRGPPASAVMVETSISVRTCPLCGHGAVDEATGRHAGTRCGYWTNPGECGADPDAKPKHCACEGAAVVVPSTPA